MRDVRIAVTGATGFIGSRLVELLVEEGVTVLALSRSARQARAIFPATRYPSVEVVTYDPYRLGDWVASLEGCAGVVHLAGAPIAGRWTTSFKQAIRESREVGTRNLVGALERLERRPPVLISSSACRYYGISDTATFDETSPAGDAHDYLSNVCIIWEAEAQRAEALDIRTVILRHGFALAMTPRFRRTLMTFRRFVGGRVGSGRQWISWIHRDDTARLIIQALRDERMSGIYNAVAPRPVRMADFARHLGSAVGGRLRLPVPSLVIEQIFGDGATVILDGQRVVSARLEETGFRFQHPELREALVDIL
jgi:uncharacterized protein (TIGR01777 family)